MKKIPKISVVTVTYNAEEFIEKSIKSVLTQTYENVEYIIVDGESSDGTLKIIDKYKDKIDILISEKDSGIYDAMNKGIIAATGEWVHFLNAGDTFSENNTLQTLSLHIDDVDILYGDLYLVHINNTKRYLPSFGTEMIFENPPCWHQAMLINLAYHKNTLYDMRYLLASDYDFMLKSYFAGKKFKYIHYPFCDYLTGGESTKQLYKHRLEALEIFAKYTPENSYIHDNFFYKDCINLYEDKNEDSKFYNKVGIIQNKLDSFKQSYKKIALYGYGSICKFIAPYLKKQLLVIVDNNAKNIESEFEICSLDDLKKYDYDAIIITLIGREKPIYSNLVYKYAVDKSKILHLNSNDLELEIVKQSSNEIYESAICTQEQLNDPKYKDWYKQIKIDYCVHRKIWEYAFICESLYKHGMLKKGKKALGFAVGTEPLASLFCKYGVEVLATDLDFDEAKEIGWVSTNQHAKNLASLNSLKICEDEQFNKLCRFKNVDMNNIPDDLGQFDFVWSACALEHLGNIRLGEEFIYNSLKYLKPGGIAVHTTEFNYSSNTDTLVDGPAVLFRRKDIEKIRKKLLEDGYEVSEINYDGGIMPYDKVIDMPPYKQDIHLKISLNKYVVTSIGLVIKKKS